MGVSDITERRVLSLTARSSSWPAVMTNKMSDGLEVRCEKYLRPIPAENYLYKLNGETMEITGLKVRVDDRSVCFGSVVCAYV